MRSSRIDRVALDFDEVIYPFSDAVFQYYHETAGSTRKFNGRGVGYRFHHAWGLTEKKVIERIINFFDTDAHQEAEPIEGSVDAVARLAASGVSLTIITARQHLAFEQTADWVDRHFKGLFDDIITCNHFSSNGEASIPKPEAMLQTNSDLLIDDSPGHVRSALEIGKEGIVFGDYSWNTGHDDLERYSGWSDSLLKRIIATSHEEAI